MNYSDGINLGHTLSYAVLVDGFHFTFTAQSIQNLQLRGEEHLGYWKHFFIIKVKNPINVIWSSDI